MTEQLTPQHLRALALANDTRMARAADKRRIKRNEISVSALLMDPPEHWMTARILDLLLAMPWVGRQKAQRWLWLECIDPGVRLERLTFRQRSSLARHMDLWSARRDDIRRQMEGR